jgi:hypothetical protein
VTLLLLLTDGANGEEGMLDFRIYQLMADISGGPKLGIGFLRHYSMMHITSLKARADYALQL